MARPRNLKHTRQVKGDSRAKLQFGFEEGVERRGKEVKRIQRKRTAGWRMPPNTVYVGRPTPFGNPYKLGKDGNVDTVLFLYKRHLELCLMGDHDFLEPLKGKDLACWCPLNKPCHVDILLKFLEAKQ